MSDEWDTSGYDGGFIGDEPRRKGSRRHTTIPKFRRIKRRRPVQSESDPKTILAMWTLGFLLTSLFFHTEEIFMFYYGVFVLYTIFTKHIVPIRLVFTTVKITGIIFFIALTLFSMLLLLFGDFSFFREPSTWIAYRYIIGVPLLSWIIVRALENWIHEKQAQ